MARDKLMFPGARSSVDEVHAVMTRMVDGAHGKFMVSTGRVVPYITVTPLKDRATIAFVKSKKVQWRRFRSKIWRILTRNNWVTIVEHELTPGGWVYYFKVSAAGFTTITDTPTKRPKEQTQKVPKRQEFSAVMDRVEALVQAVPTDDVERLDAYGLRPTAIEGWKSHIGSPWLYMVVSLAAYMRLDLNYVIRGAIPARSGALTASVPPPQAEWERAVKRRTYDAVLAIRIRKHLLHDATVDQIADAMGSAHIRARTEAMLRGKGIPLETELVGICNALDADAHRLLTGIDLDEA